MNCLPCFRKKGSDEKKSDEKKSDDVKEDEELLVAQPKENPLDIQSSDDDGGHNKRGSDAASDELPTGSARRFKYQELALATNNFEEECLVGESGIGQVFKGSLADGKVVAVKHLHQLKTKASKEFTEEVIKLSDLRHPNLMELVGYCVDNDHRLLVYNYMPMGSINDHLHDLPPGKKPLDWIIRMKIAAGTAQALEYLHEKVDPPVRCGNIRSTNVLLDKNFNPKVGDYGLVNLESTSSGSNVHKMVVGTVGCAPESEYTGELTLKSHVYSFGVVLLELITGRKALDDSRPIGEQNLVYWAQPYFNNPKKILKLVDPIFKGVVPEKILNQAADVAAMCLQDEWSARPSISDIIRTLSFLTVPPLEGFISPPAPTSGPPKKYMSSSSSSSSSSSDSDSDQELGIKIEPFNRPEPRPEPELDIETHLEPEWESETEPEWESEQEVEAEPEPEPEPELELDLTYSDSDSDSDSDSTPEPISNFEQVLDPLSKHESEHDVTNSDSGLDSDSDPKSVSKHETALEPVSKPESVSGVIHLESKSDSDLEPISKPVAVLEPVSKPEPVPEQVAKPEPVPEQVAKPEPVPEPVSKPEPVPELVSNPEPVLEPVSKPEPLLEQASIAKPEPDVTDPDSDSVPEPISKPEPVLEQVSKPEPVHEPEPSSSHKDEPGSDHDSDGSSGSIYDEDAYSEEDFSDEDKPNTSILINSKSKANLKAKSTKKKVMFKPEEADSINPSLNRVKSRYSKKSFNKSKDDDDQSSSDSYNQQVNTKSVLKSDSRGEDHSDIEITDESEDEFEPQRFKSTISRFSAESRSYSEYQDQSDHGSSSEGEQ